MNKSAFFDALRADRRVFGAPLGQRQVDGLEALLSALRGFPRAHAAHVLAEVYHETGKGMYPIKETVFPSHRDKNPSDATVISRLNKAFARGHLPWVKTPYWRDGWFGRGMIQITHRVNYSKLSPVVGVDLVENRDKALDLKISAEIAAEGCRLGLFTGKKLADFDHADGYDHYNARAIVNGDKAANGDKIALYAAAFEDALDAADWNRRPPVLPDVEPVEAKREGGLAGLIKALLKALGLSK